jgi:hypothetical protein
MGFPKGVEHPLYDILIGTEVNTAVAKWFRLLLAATFLIDNRVSIGCDFTDVFA